VLVAAVVRDEVDDDPDVEAVRVRDELLGVGKGSEHGLDVAVVRHVVAAVGERARVPRVEPDGVETEARDVLEPGAETGQVTDAVAVAVREAAQVDLVDGCVAPPTHLVSFQPFTPPAVSPARMCRWNARAALLASASM